MSIIFIYSTFPDEKEARSISRALVEARLVACANIMAPNQSIYHWDGVLEEGEEVAVIFKTRAELFETVKGKIVKLHSYDCPCVVALPIENGHIPFLDWVEKETA